MFWLNTEESYRFRILGHVRKTFAEMVRTLVCRAHAFHLECQRSKFTVIKSSLFLQNTVWKAKKFFELGDNILSDDYIL